MTKSTALAGAAIAPLLALCALDAAHAQAAEASSEVGEVVVTGSRIVRSGFTAPTPTTVLGVEEIAKKAPVNIADYVNQLPQLAANTTPRVGNGGTSTGTNGINSLNLRGLGANRTLILLDGQRVVPSGINAAVDINNLPTALVERIDVVTGGASAVYGSDAVAGVVNFIVNKRFTGIKGTFSGGVTSRGDDRTYTGELAYGRAFAGGRGHVLASAEFADVEGIDSVDREWFDRCNMLVFAASVQPQRVVRCNVNTRTVAQGGVITSTALANTQFGVGGVPLPFVLGAPTDTLFMVGGNTWTEGDTVALDSKLKRRSFWGRVSYDLTDDITASFEASYGGSKTRNTAAYQRSPGAGSTALTVRADNPYLPQSIRDRATQLGISTFLYGYSSYDLGKPRNEADRDTYRAVASLNGALAGNWKWNAYYQYGRTDLDVRLTNTTNNARFRDAIDVARDASGQIVCRSTLTSPGNGCVPLNIFGIGVASPQAIAYVKGVATQALRLRQDVAAFNISGEAFQGWAGPISVAAGAEYRKEQVSGTADSISIANGFFTGNFKPTVGHYDVKEGFIEVDAPLLRDAPLAQSVEFNGAFRYTSYSLAGGVTTWKAGLTWTPVADLRLRAVRSRDIRAPNLGDLFQAGQTQRNDVIDTAQAGRPSVSITRVTSGNPALTPEIADTTSVGVVYRPSWLPQVSASVDYYSIDIKDAIASLANQDIVDRCVRGETAVCSLVVRSNGQITQLLAIPINVAQQITKGVDLEVSVRQDFGDRGALTARFLATRILDFYTLNGGIKTDTLGQNTGSTPKWRWLASVGYDWRKVTLNVSARGFSSGVYDNTWRSGIEIEDNHIDGAAYVDLSAQYKFKDAGGRRLIGFVTVENLLDRDPEIIGANGLSAPQFNPVLYDVLGRNFRVGVRFQY
jgi:outer membrane receptor protein involved in Fe transport